MSKSFLNYLITKNMITVDQALRAVLEQMKTAPSIGELVFKYDVLPKADQWRILSYMQGSGLDYRSSAKSLGLWNDAIDQKIRTNTLSAMTPLGEILVNLGYINSKDLFKFLDGYICHQASGLTESLRPTSINSALVASFIETYQAQTIPRLRLAILQLEKSGLTMDELLSATQLAKTEFLGMKAAGCFFSGSTLESLALSVIRTCDEVLATPHNARVSMLRSSLAAGFAAIQVVCQHIKATGEEPESNHPALQGSMNQIAHTKTQVSS
jgi:hypothetical protein